jgi:hypothetical protein
LEAFEDGLRLEHHSLAAAKRPVVYGAMAIVRERPQIVYANFNEPGIARPAHDTVIQWPAKEVRKNGNDLELHIEPTLYNLADA